MFEVSADRTAVEVLLAMPSALLLVVPRTETVALIRTASGTTVVVPVALTVRYRVLRADAGVAEAAPPTSKSVNNKARALRKGFRFMPPLSSIFSNNCYFRVKDWGCGSKYAIHGTCLSFQISNYFDF